MVWIPPKEGRHGACPYEILHAPFRMTLAGQKKESTVTITRMIAPIVSLPNIDACTMCVTSVLFSVFEPTTWLRIGRRINPARSKCPRCIRA